MKQIVLPIIFSCIVSQVLCLKCYEWSDKTELGETVECPAEANACLKAEAEVYQTKAYARSCGVLEGDAKDGDCVGKNGEEMEEGDVGEAFVCFCTTDLCNKASGLISSSSYVYLVIPLLIYQVL